jgi:hypothetical protein
MSFPWYFCPYLPVIYSPPPIPIGLSRLQLFQLDSSEFNWNPGILLDSTRVQWNPPPATHHLLHSTHFPPQAMAHGSGSVFYSSPPIPVGLPGLWGLWGIWVDSGGFW